MLSKNMSLELDGLKLTSRPLDGNGRLICYFGTKFDNIYEFLKIFLRRGMVFVDIGANIGSHTVNAARLVGNTGAVYAFEADFDTYRLLLENIGLNNLSNVTARQTCVADDIGVVSFFKHKDSAKSSIVDRGEDMAVTLPADKLDVPSSDDHCEAILILSSPRAECPGQLTFYPSILTPMTITCGKPLRQ